MDRHSCQQGTPGDPVIHYDAFQKAGFARVMTSLGPEFVALKFRVFFLILQRRVSGGGMQWMATCSRWPNSSLKTTSI